MSTPPQTSSGDTMTTHLEGVRPHPVNFLVLHPCPLASSLQGRKKGWQSCARPRSPIIFCGWETLITVIMHLELDTYHKRQYTLWIQSSTKSTPYQLGFKYTYQVKGHPKKKKGFVKRSLILWSTAPRFFLYCFLFFVTSTANVFLHSKGDPHTQLLDLF